MRRGPREEGANAPATPAPRPRSPGGSAARRSSRQDVREELAPALPLALRVRDPGASERTELEGATKRLVEFGAEHPLRERCRVTAGEQASVVVAEHTDVPGNARREHRQAERERFAEH